MACFTPWVISARPSRLRQTERKGKKKKWEQKQLWDVQLRRGGERRHSPAGWAPHPSPHTHTSVSLCCQGGPHSASHLTRGTTLARAEESLRECSVFEHSCSFSIGWLVLGVKVLAVGSDTVGRSCAKDHLAGQEVPRGNVASLLHSLHCHSYIFS